MTFVPYALGVSRCVRALALSLSVLVVGTLTALAPSPASAILVNPNSASTGILCRGFSGCASAGMSSAGYSSVYRSMFWRMYGGHNCTNYAAYRMVHSGLPNSRPWSGSGNATNWGYANSRVTSSVPSVGAVAWWRAYARPAGSAGHVAYVERVVSRDEIIVSQDSWGGDFSWARITRNGGSWPTGFVHFHDVAALHNTARPMISGTTKVRSTLTATSGSWSPSKPAISYQWLADGNPITAAATSRTFVVKRAQRDKTISVRVTGTPSSGRPVSVTSTPTAVIRPAVIRTPVKPTVQGDPAVGSRLSVLPGTWAPGDTTRTYQWSAGGVPIAGANRSSLTLEPAQVGKPIAVSVTGHSLSYRDVTVTTIPTSPVAPGTVALAEPATVTGLARTGQVLTLEHGATDPADAGVSVQWLRAGKPVAGATSTTYRTSRADLGSALVAQLTATRAGYRPLVTRTAPTRLVRATPALTVVATPRPGSRMLDLTARVTTLEMSPVLGTLGVRLDGELVRTVDLRRGSAATTLAALTPGRHSIRVWYRRTTLVASASQVRTVTIP